MSNEQAESVAAEEQPKQQQQQEEQANAGDKKDEAPAAGEVKENGDAAASASATPPAEEAAPEAEPPKEMRAVVLNSFGGLKSVKILKKPEPTVGEGELLIRVSACGLNFQDLMLRQGVIDCPPKCPFILGTECAGEIEQVGEGVEGYAVGDKVVALTECRAWAELVAVPAKFVYKLPPGMSPMDAAAITMNYTVAYILLFEMAGITNGKSLLVHSAGGGVGQAVVQLARTVPDVTIFGVCSKGKHEHLNGNAANIDHLLERSSDYPNEVRKIKPEGVDVVLDCLCGEECNRGFSLLKPMGKYILFGSSNVVTGETRSIFSAARSWWQVDKISPIKLFDENKTMMGFNMRHLMFHQGEDAYVRSVVGKVFDLFTAGKIKPYADSTWALEDVADAMQKMHDRKNVGKIIIDPTMEPKPKPATPAKGKKKQSSEEKKDDEDKKKEEKKEESPKEDEKKEEVMTNGDHAAEEEAKEKEEEKASS